jgi:hypothetical protein
MAALMAQVAGWMKLFLAAIEFDSTSKLFVHLSMTEMEVLND